MKFPRSSGVLLHISSLPSDYGIGDLGPNAYKFVDWLDSTRQTLWQILPLSITDDKGCPYSSCSAYGANPLLISPETLVKDKLLNNKDLIDATKLFGNNVNYELVFEYKSFLFHKAFDHFKKKKDLIKKLEKFNIKCQEWLDDLALFQVLSEQFGTNWIKWPERYRTAEPEAIKRFTKTNKDQIDYHKFLQFIFIEQWTKLKEYANSKAIKIIGDIPIFLSHQSMDVWKNQELFVLAAGEPYVVTGAPPDNFSLEGQKWGNPNYNWHQMEQDGFQWWIKRVKYNTELYDIVRLDHFRGFAATWEIPVDNPYPTAGYWSPVPGHNLFHCLGESLGELPLIAEDLGKITPDVEWLRDRFGFTGMKILQFAFDEGEYNKHLPHNFHSDNCVVYTGTHDNPTTKGWFDEMGDTLEKHYASRYSGAWNWDNINWSLIALALNSRADMAIIPLQDIMGLGNEARMNTPGSATGNWTWRFDWEQLKSEDSHHFSDLCWHSYRNHF